MRKLTLAIAFLCPFALADCAGYSTTIGNLAAAQPDITNDISLACQSADGLLRLAAARVGNVSVASAASRLDAGVNTYCTKAINEAPAVATALSVVNTAAAVLLGAGVAR